MNIKGIIIHCSDSPQGRGDTAEDIHRWHKERGFDGVGYHHIIDENGKIENGRPHYWSGAHASGYNSTHLGICLIGVDQFTLEQYDSLKVLVGNLMIDYNLKKEDVLGHYQVSSKSCPNFDVVQFMEVNFAS